MSMAEIFKTDPLVVSNFWLDIPGVGSTFLSEVSGLDQEIEVVEAKTVSEKGQHVSVKTMGQVKSPSEITVKRVAATDMASDPIWSWFNDIRKNGIALKDRTDKRKDGSVVVYDATNAEVARWNFYKAWPSKISTDSLSAGGSDAVNETITLQIERLERTK